MGGRFKSRIQDLLPLCRWKGDHRESHRPQISLSVKMQAQPYSLPTWSALAVGEAGAVGFHRIHAAFGIRFLV